MAYNTHACNGKRGEYNNYYNYTFAANKYNVSYELLFLDMHAIKINIKIQLLVIVRVLTTITNGKGY